MKKLFLALLILPSIVSAKNFNPEFDQFSGPTGRSWLVQKIAEMIDPYNKQTIEGQDCLAVASPVVLAQVRPVKPAPALVALPAAAVTKLVEEKAEAPKTDVLPAAKPSEPSAGTEDLEASNKPVLPKKALSSSTSLVVKPVNKSRWDRFVAALPRICQCR